jgi:NAD(P)-dependent dehydrogenase (short-subunit alcohol dehydrogenase family)
MYKDIFRLDGKVAVVTGGAGLLGREFVRSLACFGATVVIADTDAGLSRQLLEETGDKDVYFRKLDITKEAEVASFINAIDNEFGRIDIWVNSAYPRTKDWGMKLENIRLSSWRKNVDMHLNGYFICCSRIAEYMKKQKSGSIINIASVYGVVAPDFSIYEGTQMTMPAAYSAIKAGIINFTRYLASYYGRYNIRVNCVSPGGVYDGQPKRFIDKYSAKVPLKKMADKKDIAGAIVYLSSDAAKYVTGHNLIVDGGFTII